jgi:hypothetical protein
MGRDIATIKTAENKTSYFRSEDILHIYIALIFHLMNDVSLNAVNLE